MSLSIYLTLPTKEFVEVDPQAKDPLLEKTIEELYKEHCLDHSELLFLALANNTVLEGTRLWKHIRDHADEEVVIPGTTEKVTRLFFYTIDSPRLRSERLTPKAQFLIDADALTADTLPAFHQVLDRTLPPALFLSDLESRGHKTVSTKDLSFMRTGLIEADKKALPLPFTELLREPGTGKVLEENIISIHPAFLQEKMRRNPRLFYKEQNETAPDLTDDYLKMSAAEYQVAAVRLVTNPDFYSNVEMEMDPHFLFGQGFFFSMLCLERGLLFGAHTLRLLLMMDADLNEGRCLEAFDPKNYTSVAFFQGEGDLKARLMQYLEELYDKEEEINADIAVLLALYYWNEPPIAIGEGNEDIEKVNEYLRHAAEVGDGEGLYYRISLNLSQYDLEPDPVFLEYFWEDLENLLALDNSEGEQTDALKSCLDLIDLFTLTNREHWPKGVDDDKIAKVKEGIASLKD